MWARNLRWPILFVCFGCSAGVGGAPPKVDPGPDPEYDPGHHRLELVGDRDMVLAREMEGPIRVRYIDPSGGPASGTINFALEGDAAGATLEAQAVVTNQEGEATVQLLAGALDASFDVVATADDADEVVVHVTVNEAGAGDLRVIFEYPGERRLFGADVYLYQSHICEDIDDPNHPLPADALASVASMRDAAKFQALETGSVWSVLAVAIGDAGTIAAFACLDDVTVVGGSETDVTMHLGDVRLTYDGRWELESHLDARRALPANALGILSLMDEMTDDPNDPATFFLDILSDQISNDALKFAFDAGRFVAGFDARIADEIYNVAPDFAMDGMRAGGDLGRAMEDMQIDSDLTITTDEAGVSTARHELQDLVVTLDGVTNRFSIPNDVGIQDASVDGVPITIVDEKTVQVGEHQFQVPLGVMTVFILNEVVLPHFDGAPHSLGELFESIIPCWDVGWVLSDLVGVGSVDTWRGVCELGVQMLGQYFQVRLQTLDGYDTLTAQGQADLDDLNVDYSMERMEEGAWTLDWSGTSGELPLTGSFEGNKIERGGRGELR